jgi:hypothetical protein
MTIDTTAELAYLRMLTDEFKRLYLLFDNVSDYTTLEPEDLEFAILALINIVGLNESETVRDAENFRQIWLLCNSLEMGKEIPAGLSSLEQVKIFIKQNVREKRRLEKNG